MAAYPIQFVFLSIFSIRKGLIRLGSDENREERFTSKPTTVTSYQELISCHTVSLPHPESPEFPRLEKPT